MSQILERLRAAADDPMWADHAEVRKTTLAEAADQIEHFAKLAEKYFEAAVEAQEERDALRKDAARYAWLRAHVSGHRAVGSARPATFAFPGVMMLTPVGDIMRGSVAQHLDAAIDAAMEKP